MIDYKIQERLKDHLWLEELLTDAIEFGRCEAESKAMLSQLLEKYITERSVETASGFIQKWAYNQGLSNVQCFIHQDKVLELLAGIQSGKITNDI